MTELQQKQFKTQSDKLYYSIWNCNSLPQSYHIIIKVRRFMECYKDYDWYKLIEELRNKQTLLVNKQIKR